MIRIVIIKLYNISQDRREVDLAISKVTGKITHRNGKSIEQGYLTVNMVENR